jgi:nucleotide-binding universal stress UspA family protein
VTENEAAPIRRIVVGVDGSPSSIAALKWARRLALALGTEIEAVTTWEYPATYGLATVPDNWQPDLDASQQAALALTDAFGTTELDGVSVLVVEGHAAQALVQASVGAEMLVVGSRGHGGFVGLLIGSVSAYCAEHASCPVVVFHESDKAENSDKD